MPEWVSEWMVCGNNARVTALPNPPYGLTLENGNQLTATAGHPFKTTEGWRDALLLKRGGKLLLKGEGDAETSIGIREVSTEEKIIRVYNLEVSNAHTFLVGADGVVVHNRGGANVPSGSARAAMRQAKREAGIPTSQTYRTHQKNKYGGCDYFFNGGKEIQHHPNGHDYPGDNGANLPHFNNHGDGGTKNHYTY